MFTSSRHALKFVASHFTSLFSGHINQESTCCGTLVTCAEGALRCDSICGSVLHAVKWRLLRVLSWISSRVVYHAVWLRLIYSHVSSSEADVIDRASSLSDTPRAYESGYKWRLHTRRTVVTVAIKHRLSSIKVLYVDAGSHQAPLLTPCNNRIWDWTVRQRYLNGWKRGVLSSGLCQSFYTRQTAASGGLDVLPLLWICYRQAPWCVSDPTHCQAGRTYVRCRRYAALWHWPQSRWMSKDQISVRFVC